MSNGIKKVPVELNRTFAEISQTILQIADEIAGSVAKKLDYPEVEIKLTYIKLGRTIDGKHVIEATYKVKAKYKDLEKVKRVTVYITDGVRYAVIADD